MEKSVESMTIAEASYQLVVMLGEIKRELEEGGEPVTKEEVNTLYELALRVNNEV